MAYSAGFTPHPKVSYANAAPTGAASEAEYLEIALAERCDPELLRRALDDALPAGLDLVDAVEAGPGALADRLQASIWRVELPGVAPADLRAALEAFLAADRVEVQRMTKSGLRTFDARQAVVHAAVDGVEGAEPAGSVVSPQSSPETPCAILQVVVRHATPAVRPDDVLAALRAVADLAPPSPPVVTRLAQGPLDEVDGTVADPLAADRDAGGG